MLLVVLSQATCVPLADNTSAVGLSASLQRRGPDSWGSKQVSCSLMLSLFIECVACLQQTTSALVWHTVLWPVSQIDLALQVLLGSNTDMQIQGSLLQLRGLTPGVTPVRDNDGNTLVLNGENGRPLPCHVPRGCVPLGSIRLVCKRQGTSQQQFGFQCRGDLWWTHSRTWCERQPSPVANTEHWQGTGRLQLFEGSLGGSLLACNLTHTLVWQRCSRCVPLSHQVMGDACFMDSYDIAAHRSTSPCSCHQLQAA